MYNLLLLQYQMYNLFLLQYQMYNLFLLQYQIFFCVEDSEDYELIKIVNDLIAKYPAIDATLCVGKRA